MGHASGHARVQVLKCLLHALVNFELGTREKIFHSFKGPVLYPNS